MPALTLDIAIFGIFLGLNLLIGLVAGRSVKTLKDYAIGSKNFSTATMTSTTVATWVGGGFLFYALANIYTSGLQFIIVLLGTVICLLFMGQVLTVRMGEFLNHFSVAEAMGDLYGPAVRIITAISGIVSLMGYVAIQFNVIARMIALLLDIEGLLVAVITGIIVIFYSAFGGVRSVAITDVLQFVIFSIFIPILALIIWNSIRDPSQVVSTLTTSSIFSFREVVGWNTQFIASLSLLLFFAIPRISPPIFQRIAMARDIIQAKQTFTYAGGVQLLMLMSLAWIAILLLTDNPHLDPNSLVNYIINHYAYPGLKGLIALGITALAMSTADSDLNASAVLVVHDIIKPFKPALLESLKLLRVFSFVLGAGALILALRTNDLLELLLLANSLYMPIVTVPLLLAIFGFRTSTRAVLIGMTTGFITVLVWMSFFTYTGLNSAVPGMIASLTCLMGSHYLLREPGGWVGIKEPAPLLAARQARRDAWIAFFKAIKHPQLYTYLKKNLPPKDGLYFLFGIYVIGATYTSFFTIPEAVVATYQKLYDHIAHSVLIASAAFITYPAWPPTFKGERFVAFAWPLGIGYILFVVGTVLVVMSGFHQVQVMIFMLNLVMAVLLLYWPLMILLLTSGILLALGAFKLYAGAVPLLGVADALQFRVIYGIPLFVSLLVALVRTKQIQARLVEQNTYLLNTQEEAKAQLMGAIGYRKAILQEVEQGELNIFDNVTAAYVRQAVYRMIDYLELDTGKVNIEQLLSQTKATLKLQDLEPQPQLIINKETKHEEIQADGAKIQQLLVESIVYIQQHNTAHQPIMIELANATLGHQLDHMEGYTKKLRGLKMSITTKKTFPPSQEVYMISPIQGSSQCTEGMAELPLLENIRIIDAHYGYATVIEPHTHVYVIPVNVREIRSKVMELLRKPIAADPEALKHPLAIRLEKELFNKLVDTGVDLQVIHRALDTIKKYHGGVKRKSGEPFFTHPMAVALILLEHSQDQDAVLAALLHDTVEDTQLSLVHIRAMFGEVVTFLVEKATNLQDNIRRLSLDDHETLSRLLHYEDPRAALVKLSDRLHNMRTIKAHSSLAKQKRIAYETLIFFVPLAMKLELGGLAQELKKLSLEVLGQSEEG